MMTGRLVDTYLGSYDCKLTTIEGSHCSTKENKIYLKCFILGFRNVQNCSKKKKKLSLILPPQVPFKMAP